MPNALLLWVWACAYLNCAGWILSACHQLNAGGYLAALGGGLAALAVWWKKGRLPSKPCLRWQKWKRRFHRPFPLVFLILAGMAFLGGALYAPSNYDALAYRIPRVLHWLAEGQWHWIHTEFPRINTRSCGIEWVSAPFIALLKTDRLLFLINILSFLFLPGLVFSVFTRLGVRRRVAWHWMWLAPTGYGLLTQAGSLGNDLFGAAFALMAMHFAFRAQASRSLRDFLTAILAAAMMTSAKTSNLPLLLPCVIALWPSVRLVFRRPILAGLVCLMAALASALPTMALNIKYCGDWSGLRLEAGDFKREPVFQLAANGLLLGLENMAPPIFPIAGKWNATMDRILPQTLKDRLDAIIMHPDNRLHLEEMQVEENAGLGFGLTALVLAGLMATGFSGWKISADALRAPSFWLRWAPWVSLAALMTQSHMCTLSRLVLSYYLLLLPALLTGDACEKLTGQKWWRVSAGMVFCVAMLLLVISPARPLFPAKTVTQFAAKHHPQSKFLERAATVYETYRDRPDAFASIRATLPEGITTLGIVTFDDPETSLWRPFGSRRIEHVCPDDSPEYPRQRNIQYLLVKTDRLEIAGYPSLDKWLEKMNASLIQTLPMKLRVSTGERSWCLVKLN